MSVNHYEPSAPTSRLPQPPTKRQSALRRLLGYIGSTITWLRNTVLNIFFVVVLLLIILAIGSNAPQPLPEQFALRLAPSGMLVDQRSYMDPTSLLLSDDSPYDSETLVSDQVEAINKAALDPHVSLIVLEPANLLGGGITKMNEIGQAMENFKSKNKKIIAVSDNYTQDQYYLASFANEIYLHDMGVVEITGFERYMTYYKTALDKLGIQIHAFRSGKYKDYLEPFLRDDMSEESRQHNSEWVNQLWTAYTGQIEQARNLPSGAITDYVNNLDSHMSLTAGDSAKLALQKGLVDHVTSRQEIGNRLIAMVGKNDEDDAYQNVNTKAYLTHIRRQSTPPTDKIGVLVASGTIVDGYQPQGSIGSESMVELLRSVHEDPAVKALVIRVDSGGGSAFASEIIRSEILSLKEKGIPIFISMGTVAASGGYWIATAADQIWALPTTITGSIGVFGAFPTFDQSLQKIGVNTDGVGSTELAGSMRVDRPLSAKASRVVQQNVDNIYQRFITLVATARNKSVEEIDTIAQGHVWTGTSAQEVGLVDHLGTLNDVIAAIALTAKLDTYTVKMIQPELSPKEEFLRQIAEGSANALAPTALLEKFALIQALDKLGPQLKPLTDLQKMNDPQGVYAQCLACKAP